MGKRQSFFPNCLTEKYKVKQSNAMGEGGGESSYLANLLDSLLTTT